MSILPNYTGNAMLNNALMTIEALAEIDSVSDITPELLKRLYHDKKLLQTNKRLKSYTMLFSLNNPLVNPAKKVDNVGEKTYSSLMCAIIDGFENQGDKICEISGLNFSRSFEEFYMQELEKQRQDLSQKIVDEKQLKKTLNNINNTDISINRTWFPIIGGLGSDAQALPQAKFGVQIHPICIAILQFLPLSAVLYKGGVLLVDSSNFELSKGIIELNVAKLKEKIEIESVTEQIENFKDFSKGNFISTALNILAEKEDLHETFSDLNLWSFSNSGTGASCEIDRVPNSLIRKIQRLHNNSRISNELATILAKGETSKGFLDSLQDNREWASLYPNVFGGGKKSVIHEGVSVDFFEAYHEAIGKSAIISISKYIAGLIAEYKTPYFAKILGKTDAWRDPEFKIELYRVLLRATEEGKWDLNRQIAILDNNEALPAKNNFYNLQKTVYYYTYKNSTGAEFTEINNDDTAVAGACRWMISLIEEDERFTSIKSNLANPAEYDKVGYNRIFFAALERRKIKIEEIVGVLYNENFYYQKTGMNELLRIYFSQPNDNFTNAETDAPKTENESLFENWKTRILAFAEDYKRYYFEKYQNPQTGEFPVQKFKTVVNAIVNENEDFSALLKEMIFNTNEFLRKSLPTKDDKWLYEDIMTDPLGNKNWNICAFTVKFLLKQISINPTNN